MPLVLFAAFLIVPILEIAVIIQVGQVIGGWPTVGLLIAISVAGAWVVRREGRRAWRGLNEALTSGRMPDRELADGALVLIGGALLLTPGFLTDAVGFFLVLPFTRPITRRALAAFMSRRMRIMAARAGAGPGFGARKPYDEPHEEGHDGRVLRGEVMGDDKPKRSE